MTLTILAQQNAANSPYPFANGTNFNVQQNQGGSAFYPNGSRIYSAFNFAPVTNPATRANVSQLMISDPDNLLIQTALQMPENLAGKMVISSDGANAFVISESGFVSIPLGQMNQIADCRPRSDRGAAGQRSMRRDSRSAVGAPGSAQPRRRTADDFDVAVATGDQYGPGGYRRRGWRRGRRAGRRRGDHHSARRHSRQNDRIPGPSCRADSRPRRIPPSPATAPRVTAQNTANGSALLLNFNTVNRGIGTVSPVHQYVVQSNEAINIPPAIQVFQNFRNTEARGDIMPVDVGSVRE